MPAPNSKKPASNAPGAPAAEPTGSAVKAAAPRRRARTRRRFWLLLILVALGSVPFYPPLWHKTLRTLLIWQAARQNCDLSIARIDGGPLDTFTLYGLRWHQRGVAPDAAANTGTDLRVTRADLTLAWTVPWLQRPLPSWVHRLTLEGVSGRWDLLADLSRTSAITSAHPVPTASPQPPAAVGRWIDRHAARFVPIDFLIRGDDLDLRRGRTHVRAKGLRLSGMRSGNGLLLAREVEIGGPNFRNTFFNRYGLTVWQGERLTVTDLDLGPGIKLASATVDGTHLTHRRLDWEFDLTAMGGQVRGQGALNFSRPRLSLELAGSLRQMPVQSLARLLGLVGTSGGLVEQGDFSFHGDPEDWKSADMWLTAQATDFRWERRRWQSLELRAVVLHRRVQIHRLELRQSRNRLSLQGEWALPPDTRSDSPSNPGWLWETGFSCTVDARLDDLRALAMLISPDLPELSGRMSVNGTLESMPGQPGVDGYLNVEGSQLTVRGAPLDYLRSTLLFKGEEMHVADLQATRGPDYVSGRGLLRLVNPSNYWGEMRVAVEDPTVYAPALAGVFNLEGARFAGHADEPIRFDGVFYGPGSQGAAVFQTFSAPRLKLTASSEWPSRNWWDGGFDFKLPSTRIDPDAEEETDFVRLQMEEPPASPIWVEWDSVHRDRETNDALNPQTPPTQTPQPGGNS